LCIDVCAVPVQAATRPQAGPGQIRVRDCCVDGRACAVLPGAAGGMDKEGAAHRAKGNEARPDTGALFRWLGRRAQHPEPVGAPIPL